MLAPDTSRKFAELCVRDAAEAVARMLAAAGIDTPGRDARLLVAAAIGGTAEDLIREPQRRLSEKEAAALETHAHRRARREPVSRILGERAFYGRMFHVSPATLDPRPCSETLIDAMLEMADEAGWLRRPIRIVDVGTGSGCLLLTLLAELPLAAGLGTDVSPDALTVAQRNADRLRLSSRTRFERRHYLEGIHETFDILVSNPPYVRSAEIAALEPEVRDYDPRAALDGGPDGLEAYRQLAAECLRVVPEGMVMLEVAAGQAPCVARIFGDLNVPRQLSTLRSWKDLGGHVRCVALRTQS